MTDPTLTTVLLPGDPAPPAEHVSFRAERIREWHTRTVCARAVVVDAAVRAAATEAAFDEALDSHQPMATLRALDREMDDAAREHRAAIAHADHMARLLADATITTSSESEVDPCRSW